jgi:hypothetical protein
MNAHTPSDERLSKAAPATEASVPTAEPSKESARLPKQRAARVTQSLQTIRMAIKTPKSEDIVIAQDSITPTALRPSVNVSTFPGLLYYQIVAPTSGKYLISAWASQAAYGSHHAEFAALFTPITGSSWVGHQSAAEFPVETRRRRFLGFIRRNLGYFLAAIAAVAALLSHVDSIVDFGSQYAAPAKVDVVASPINLPVTKGQRFSTEFELQNISSFGSCSIAVEQGELLDAAGNMASQGVVLDGFKPKNFPLVGPADAKLFTLQGRAVKPGVYQIRISGHSRPVYFDYQSCFQATRLVEVWDDAAIVRTGSAEPYRTGARCRASIRVRTGSEYTGGLSFTAQVEREANVKFAGVSMAGARTSTEKEGGSTGQEIAKIEWDSIRTFDKFEEVDGFLILTTIDEKPLPRTRKWQDIVDKISFGRPVAAIN